MCYTTLHSQSLSPHLITKQVYLPTIEGHVPDKMVYVIRSFLEFCYIAQWDVITEKILSDLEDALAHFCEYWAVFQEEGIQVSGFSLP
jgi:hypothetical protein